MLPFVGVLAYFLGEFGFFLALILAVLVHESAHLLAAKMLKARVTHMRLMPFGAKIDVDFRRLTRDKRMAIMLAGVAGNVVFTLSLGLFMWMFPTIFWWFETLVMANAVVVVLNLLPIWPLDGGKILALMLKKREIEILERARDYLDPKA